MIIKSGPNTGAAKIAAGQRPAQAPVPEGEFPADLFTPEALAACPHARKMFEQIQTGQKPAPAPQTLNPAPGSDWQMQFAPATFVAKTAPPAASSWPTAQKIAQTLAGAATNVEDNALSGEEMGDFRKFTRQRIDDIQRRQLDREEKMHRLVHTQQLHGGEVEVHWNPNLEQHLNLFGLESQGGLVRFSDAANTFNADGKSMFGMALELVGNDGEVTDILLTGGNEATEASQAQDPKAQLALFNMLDHPFKVGGLAQMGWEVGPVEAAGMVKDVTTMKTDLGSLAELTAWSRAPFRLTGKNGEKYLVKMRATPAQDPGTPLNAQGETSSERLINEFDARTQKGETRWKFQLQFMQPGEDPNDGRQTWGGEWLTAAEIVVPQNTDAARAKDMAQAAEDTKFNVWKGKEAHDRGADAEVFDPHGWTNQARLWAYGKSAANRGVS